MQNIERELAILTEEFNRPKRIDNSGTCVWSLKTSVEELSSYLDNIRIAIKYLVFDVEATQRENEYLRNLLREENR